MKTLVPGVFLHVIPSTKYKTIRLNIRFTAPLAVATIAPRTLLSSVLETSSAKYPTQTAIANVLDELYGASFGMSVAKQGQRHFFTVTLNVVNDKFLEEKGILQEAVDFLREVLFAPLLEGDGFHQETFHKEQENLMRYIEGIYEDKQSYSSLKLQEVYFNDPAQKIPSFGTQAMIKALTPTSLYTYYQEMLTQDQVDISLVGDVSEKEASALFQDFPFTPRKVAAPEAEVFYHQALSNVVKEEQEQQPVLQSKLNLAYQVPETFLDAKYFASIVFNGLFGGFPHSKLFMNVREKESLAYYASSSVDSYRRYLTVQTGIDGKNRNHVLHLIEEQLRALQRGEFTDLEFQQTKANLKNQFLMQQDSPQRQLELAFQQRSILGRTMTVTEWLQLLADVTPQDVVDYAKACQLQSIYFLEGSAHEDWLPTTEWNRLWRDVT